MVGEQSRTGERTAGSSGGRRTSRRVRYTLPGLLHVKPFFFFLPGSSFRNKLIASEYRVFSSNI